MICIASPRIAMLMLTVMSVVHEQVHQGAGEQEQPRQPAKYVRPVFDDQHDQGDQYEAQEHAIGPPAGRMSGVVDSPELRRHG